MSEGLGFDVERNMKHLKEIVNKDDSLTLSSRFVKYLIEQDERVVELERKVRVDSELFDKQVKQNKRYREALEFYSKRDNYESKHFDPNIVEYMSTIDYDEGKEARQALESESSE